MSAPGSDVPAHLASVWRRADELRAQGDVPGALAALEPAAEVASMAYGSDSPAALITLHRLAVLYRLQGDLAGARRVLDEAQAGGELRFGDDDPLMLAVAAELGAVAEELGNRHEARRNWSKVARYGPDRLGAGHPQVRAAEAYLQDDPAGPVYVPPERPVLDEPTQTSLPTVPRPAFATPPNPTTPPSPTTPPGPATPPGPTMEPSAGSGIGWPAPLPPIAPPPHGTGGHLAPGPPPSGHPLGSVASGQPAGPVGPGQPERYPAHPADYPVEQGVWRINRPEVPVPPAGESSSGGGRRGRIVLLAVLLVVLLAGAVVIGGLLQRRADDEPGGGASPAGTASVDTGTATLPSHRPPTGLQLRDNGDHATLTWTDPSAGTVPFIISGGRAGQEQHTYATVAAGTTSYPVNALNVNYDYCFVVIAVYSTSDLVTSDLVCTHRHVTPSATG